MIFEDEKDKDIVVDDEIKKNKHKLKKIKEK